VTLKLSDHAIKKTKRPTNSFDIVDMLPSVVPHRDAMVRAVGAILPFACTDKYRTAMSRIQVESDGERLLLLMATDGHTASVFTLDFFEPHGIPAGECSISRESAGHFVKTKGFSPFVEDDSNANAFPDIRLAIGSEAEEGPGAFGLSPVYMARIPASLKKLGYGRCAYVRLAVSSALDPVYISAHSETVGGFMVSPLWVLMPMRMG
jgi:hypothetical protein